ncbi:hypothetical protein CD33_14920 [Ureibacillus sinduriensis BLB-1 = JCM 15800]|uniref:Uncharacterized protein n=1 Tax=Ureibacillus sinduriensis BLB-1 = JCM 15800 TaxID=1384057 RepID=A0A0A3HPC2_9BACL|nr:hypothetical protein CD33_14920 [Ureibacillus sinduriensis BLB-1 = JCM 15800]
MGRLVSAIPDTATVVPAAQVPVPPQTQLTLAANFMMNAIYTIDIELPEDIAMTYSSNVCDNIAT